MARVEIVSGTVRRRHWTDEQKRALVAESFAPGAVISAVARRAEVCPGQIYRWRQEFRSVADGFARVLVVPLKPRRPTAPITRSIASRQSRSRLPGGSGCGYRGRCRRNWQPPSSKRCRDGPGPLWDSGVAGGWPHRYAARHERPGDPVCSRMPAVNFVVALPPAGGFGAESGSQFVTEDLSCGLDAVRSHHELATGSTDALGKGRIVDHQ
jgi:transposase